MVNPFIGRRASLQLFSVGTLLLAGCRVAEPPRVATGAPLKGKVLGPAEISDDLRLLVELEDGSRLLLRGHAVSSGDRLKLTARCETSAPRYAFLNRAIVVGTGSGTPEHMTLSLEAIR